MPDMTSSLLSAIVISFEREEILLQNDVSNFAFR